MEKKLAAAQKEAREANSELNKKEVKKTASFSYLKIIISIPKSKQ
jgi:hypothetical protein